ncbi:MAG TPA: hypothetical protein VLR26_13740, partial [Frankiaceae bacterium]|nr:hypothetical protein [Frankiaceae bacterium]
ICSLGPTLRIGGRETGIPLVWRLVDGLPGFEHALPSRLALFVDAMVAVIVAAGLADLARFAEGARTAVYVAIVAAFVPLAPTPLRTTTSPDVPSLFTDVRVAELARDGNLLVLPFPTNESTDAMRWQSAADMSFAMPGGYFLAPDASGRSRLGGQATFTGSLLTEVNVTGRTRPLTAGQRERVAADFARWEVRAVVLGPCAHQAQLAAEVTSMVVTGPQLRNGALIWTDLGHVA